MIGWSKIELCWSVTKQAFDNRFDFYLTGLYKKSMRRQLENFANALSDYLGEDVDTPKDWHAAFRMLKNYLLGVCRPGKLANLILFRITRDCREMLKIVFDFPNELIDKVIEIS